MNLAIFFNNNVLNFCCDTVDYLKCLVANDISIWCPRG